TPDLIQHEPSSNKTQQTTKELHPGDEVEVLTFNQKGTILEKINKQEYLVQVGIMKVNIKRNDLKKISEKKQVHQQPITTIRGSNYQVSTELDLRGERYEEALHKLEKYIDDSLLAGHAKVSIIHGKG